ncbi:MAG: SIMPL domain-containing protein [Firmicutes bacterium]|nr:SIMPL domain-containing protein [Bacillota bacterium]
MERSDQRLIRVTGRGDLRLQPDTTRLTITLRGRSMDYAETLSQSAKDTEALRDVIAALGFARDSLKTLSFDVDTRYEYDNSQRGHNPRQIFMGYEYTHLLKLEFPSDNALLGRTLYALGASSVQPELRLSYTVRDQEGAKNRLLAGAVADAAAKARTLAEAAGVALGELISIDYSRTRIDFEVQPLRKSVALAEGDLAAPSFDLDIEPDDIEVSDTVILVWAIA